MRGQGEARTVVWVEFKANVQAGVDRGWRKLHRALFEPRECSGCTGAFRNVSLQSFREGLQKS